MSRPSRIPLRAVALIALCAAGGAGTADAQDVPVVSSDAERERVSHELDAALAHLAEVEVRWKAWGDQVRAEQARLQVLQVDTLRAGPFTVITPDEQRDRVAQIVDRVLPFYASMADALPDQVGNWRLVVRWIDPNTVKPIHVLDHPVITVEVPVGGEPADLEHRLRDVVGTAFHQALPEAIQKWAPPPVMPLSQRHGIDRAGMYRFAASRESPAVWACLNGHVGECWSAFGLAEPGTTALWAPNHVRHRALAAHGDEWVSRLPEDQQKDRRACEQWDMQACERFNAGNGIRLAVPLLGVAANTLLAHALDLGGPDAFKRLVRSEAGTVPDILAEAAGMDATDLMTRWVRYVNEGRPNAQAGLPASSAGALLWSLFIGCATVACARRRVG